jgi:ATP-dependent helicase/nuclease subunit B
VYALLWDAPVAEAMYLPVDSEDVVPVVLATDLAEHAAAVRTRLLQLVDDMALGTPLRAQGIEAVCQYCEMHGLCRRKHWT